MIHLSDFSDVLVIVVFDYIHYLFLFFVKSISYFVNISIWFLNQLLIKPKINPL